MRRLLAFLFLACPSSLAYSAGAPGSALASQEQALIQRLRTAGALTRTAALGDLRALPGYPRSARFAIPLLVWMQSDEDLTLRSAASDVLHELKWPQVIDLRGARAFAARQDVTYKMMAVKALSQVAEREPEALLLMMQLCHGRYGAVADFAEAQGKVLLRQPCRTQAEADAWAVKAGPFLAPFQSELNRVSRRGRPYLELLNHCGPWEPTLGPAAQAALERLPKP